MVVQQLLQWYWTPRQSRLAWAPAIYCLSHIFETAPPSKTSTTTLKSYQRARCMQPASGFLPCLYSKAEAIPSQAPCTAVPIVPHPTEHVRTPQLLYSSMRDLLLSPFWQDHVGVVVDVAAVVPSKHSDSDKSKAAGRYFQQSVYSSVFCWLVRLIC